MGFLAKMAKGVVALSAGGGPFVFGASPAAAEEFFTQSAFFEHRFTNQAGQTVVCPVDVSSSLFRESTNDPFLGSAFTGSDLDNPNCDAFVAASVSYQDPTGRPKNAFADSFNGDVFLGVDDVGSGFVAQHFVSFLNCSANCEVSYQTQPK
jgi:hypothetical protein